MRQKQKYFLRKGLMSIAGILAIFLSFSCLKDMPETMPEGLRWDPELAVPLGVDSFGLNLDSGVDSILLELDSLTGLPGWIEQQTVIMEGYMEFNLSTINQNLDQINRMLFRVNIYNGFPNEVLTQAYFIDDQDQILDSMFSEGYMPVPPGTVIGIGETIDPTHRRQDAVFDPQRLESLLDATRLNLQAILQNPKVDTALIPYYPGYYIHVNVGAMLDATIDIPYEEN